jgi:hypothetical protein
VTALEALVKLRNGQLDGRPVLPEGTLREDVEAGFGPSGSGRDASAVLGSEAATMREYPATPVAPDGSTAFYRGDLLLALEIPYPSLATGWLHTLGAPDSESESPLAPAHVKRVWRDAALVVHQHRYSGDVLRIDVLAAISVDELGDEKPPRRERR